MKHEAYPALALVAKDFGDDLANYLAKGVEEGVLANDEGSVYHAAIEVVESINREHYMNLEVAHAFEGEYFGVADDWNSR